MKQWETRDPLLQAGDATCSAPETLTEDEVAAVREQSLACAQAAFEEAEQAPDTVVEDTFHYLYLDMPAIMEAAAGTEEGMKVLTLLEAVTDALRTEMASDRSVVVFGEDVGLEGGVFRATAGLQKEFGEERCFDTPISEAGIVGAAVGMAVVGLRPVVEIQFSGFVFPAFNQIASHVSRIRNRTRGALTAPDGHPHALRRRHPGTRAPLGERGGALRPHPRAEGRHPLHAPRRQGAADRRHPGSRPRDLPRARRAPTAPCARRCPRRRTPWRSATARVEAEGDELTLVSYGAQMIEARQARAALAAEGHGRWSSSTCGRSTPSTRRTVVESVRKTGRLLAVHEGPQSFGVAAELMATVMEQAFDQPAGAAGAPCGPRRDLPHAARGEALPDQRGAGDGGSAKGDEL